MCADGKPYKIHQMFVASRTLPFGTTLRITNPANGRTIEASVRDRGPHVPGRVLDLSVAAATALGTKHEGVALVAYHIVYKGSSHLRRS
jgi:rare lipoprotein A